MCNSYYRKIIKIVCGQSDEERNNNVIEILSKKHGFTFNADTTDDTVIAYITLIDGFSPHSISIGALKSLNNMGASIKTFEGTNDHYLYVFKSYRNSLWFNTGIACFCYCVLSLFIMCLKIVGV